MLTLLSIRIFGLAVMHIAGMARSTTISSYRHLIPRRLILKGAEVYLLLRASRIFSSEKQKLISEETSRNS